MPETQFLGRFRMSGSSISKSFSVIRTVAGAEGHRSPPPELPGQAGASAGAERRAGGPRGQAEDEARGQGRHPPEPAAAWNKTRCPADACGAITGREKLKPKV